MITLLPQTILVRFIDQTGSDDHQSSEDGTLRSKPRATFSRRMLGLAKRYARQASRLTTVHGQTTALDVARLQKLDGL